MNIRVAVGIVSALTALTMVLSSSAGVSELGASSTHAFVSVRSLTPPRGGASRAPHGYLALHARELARIKAAANARAGLAPGRVGSVAAQDGATVSSYPNVSPSFDGDYETGLTPPDTT